MNPDSVSLFKDRWRVASDRARPIQQHRVDAYAALSSSLKDPKRLSPELLAHLCSEKESITAQILMDLENAQCRTEALHFLGCYIFHTEIAKVYSEHDVATVVKALCQVARDVAMDAGTCVRALWCLSNQNFIKSHVQASCLIILDMAGEVVCRYIHKVSMVEMEALNLLSKLYIQCHDHVITELQKWYKSVFLLLFSKVPLVQQKALTLATAMEKNDCTVLVEWVKDELKKTYLSVMLSRLDENALEHSHVILLVWAHCIRLLGKAVRDTGTFLNQLLKVAEKGFKQKGSLIQSTVYTSWQAIISNFAQDHDVLVHHKRLHLVLLPLTSPAVKECVEQVDVARLNTWWYLIGHLGHSKQQLFVQVCIPFLFFCFGLDPKYNISNLPTLLASILSPPPVAHDNGMRGEVPPYCVGSVSQALVSRRQLLANQGSRPFVLPLQLFLSGCHAVLQFTGCSEDIPGSLLNTDLSQYGIYSTSVVPSEVAGVMAVLLDAILKHSADHTPHVEDQVMSCVIGHIANVVMRTIGDSTEIDQKLVLSCLLGMVQSSEFEQRTTLAVKVKICLHSTKLPFHIRGTVHTKEGSFWKRLQIERNSLEYSMATLLTCWQEVLTGAMGNMLDHQHVHRELLLLDQRIPDRAFLETIWEVVARSLHRYVSETSYAKDFKDHDLESQLITVRHVLVFPFLCVQQQKPFSLVLELWPHLYHSVNRTVATGTRDQNWFGGVVCADILVACKIVKNVDQFDGHPEVVGAVLRSVLADFNWTHAKTEAVRRKELETILNLLAWQLTTLLVSMPSCPKPYCILMDVTRELFSHSTTIDGALGILDALAQPLANVWSHIINSLATPTSAIQEGLPNVIACWSTVIDSLRGLTHVNCNSFLRVLSPLLVVTLTSHLPELVNMAITFWANTFDRCLDIKYIVPDKIKEALLEYSKVTARPLPLNFFTLFSKEVTVVEDSVMATADAAEGVVLNRPGNQPVLSSPVPKMTTIEGAVAMATNQISTPNRVTATSCLMTSSTPNTSSSFISVSPNQSELELRLSFVGSNSSPTAGSVAGSSLSSTATLIFGSNPSPTAASAAGSGPSPSVASAAGSGPSPASVAGSGPRQTAASAAISGPSPTVALSGSTLSSNGIQVTGSTSRPASIPVLGTTSGSSTTTALKCDDHFTNCRVMVGSKRSLECVQPARKKLHTDDVTILEIDPDVVIMSPPAKKQRISVRAEVKGSPPEDAHQIVCCDEPGDDDGDGATCSDCGSVGADEAMVEKSPPKGVVNSDAIDSVVNRDITEDVVNHSVVEDTPPNGVIPPVALPTSVEFDEHLSGAQTSAIQNSTRSPSFSNLMVDFKDAVPRSRGRGRGRSRGLGVATRGSKSLSLDQHTGGVVDEGVARDTQNEGPRQAVRRKSTRGRGRGRGSRRHDDGMDEEEPIPSNRKRRKRVKSPDGEGAPEDREEETVPPPGRNDKDPVVLQPVAFALILGVNIPSLATCAQTIPTTSTLATSAAITLTTPTTFSTGAPMKNNPFSTNTCNPVGILKNPRVLSKANKDKKVKFATGPKLVRFIEPSQEPVVPLTTSETAMSTPSSDQPGPSSSAPTGPFFPSLSSCPTPIQEITPSIAGNRSSHGLLQFLKAKNIATVGNIASLTEQQVIALPIKLPKVQTLRIALERYETVWQRSEGQKENFSDRVEQSSHQPSPPVQSLTHQPSLTTVAPSQTVSPSLTSPDALSRPHQSGQKESGFTQSQDTASPTADDVTLSTPDSADHVTLSTPDSADHVTLSTPDGADHVTLSTPDSQQGAVTTPDDMVPFTPHDDQVTTSSTNDEAISTHGDQGDPIYDQPSSQCVLVDLRSNSSPPDESLLSPSSISPPFDELSNNIASSDDELGSQPHWLDEDGPVDRAEKELQSSLTTDSSSDMECNQPIADDYQVVVPVGVPVHSSLTHSTSIPLAIIPVEEREVVSNWNKDVIGSQELFSCSSVMGSEGCGGESVPKVLPQINQLPFSQIPATQMPHLTTSLSASPACSRDTDCSTQTPPTTCVECFTQTPPLPAPPTCSENGTQTPPLPVAPVCYDDSTQTPPLPTPPPCTDGFAQTVAPLTVDSCNQTTWLQLTDQSQQACPVVMETMCQTSGPDVESKGVNTTLHGTDRCEILAQLLSEMASDFDRLDFSAQVDGLQRCVQQFSTFTALLVSKLNNSTK